MSETIDHDMTQSPVCPWCGEDNGWPEELDTVCDSCGKRFTVELHTVYSTERVEDEHRGL